MLKRRQIIKAGLTIPFVITLAPKQARANGSWMSSSDPSTDYGIDQGTGANTNIYGSWQWRRARMENMRCEQIRRQRYGGFGEE